MKAVIIAGGVPPSLDLIMNELQGDCVLICADSGANCLLEYKINPDYLIGDFDSIDEKALMYFSSRNCVIEEHPSEKDETDSELALIKAIELKPDQIALLGCTGNRLDHTFGNLGLLMKCLNTKIQAYIRDEKNTMWLANKSLSIYGKTEEYFSLLAYGSDVSNISIRGAKYSLNNYHLKLGSSLTVSNRFIDSKVEISFSDGILLITKSFD